MSQKKNTQIRTVCKHCGDQITNEVFDLEQNVFCCNGCLSVYQMINAAGLDDFYQQFSEQGLKQSERKKRHFDIYDDTQLLDKVLLFKSEDRHRVLLTIAEISCISCVWLLEKLAEFTDGILNAEVNLERKQLQLDYNPNLNTLAKILHLLHQLGYNAEIRKDKSAEVKHARNNSYKKLAIAGFAFGNVMLLAVPEFFNTDFKNSEFIRVFPLLALFFSTISLFYSGFDYLRSAVNLLKNKKLNMDVPIALGLIVLYLTSIYDVFVNGGIGYFDSLAGFIFFLLVSKSYQVKAFDSLEFQKDSSDILPLLVRKKVQDDFVLTPINELSENDIIQIRDGEIIPCDSELISSESFIDNSYITGESTLLHLSKGAKIYAGAKQATKASFLLVKKKSDQSYLTSLWQQAKTQKKAKTIKFIDKIAPYFTLVVLGIAFSTLLFSFVFDLANPVQRMLSVLIVACPCALALASPFTFGTTSNLLAKHGFYFRDTDDIERAVQTKSLLFDKTGTLTEHSASRISTDLQSSEYNALIKAAVKDSIHPLAQEIFSFLHTEAVVELETIQEFPHRGILASNKELSVHLGSYAWFKELGMSNLPEANLLSQHVAVAINTEFIGYFIFKQSLRSGIQRSWQNLKEEFNCIILSGDHKSSVEQIGAELNLQEIRSSLSPSDKSNFVHNLAVANRPVMMFGDGMNDSAALSASDIGVSVIEEHSFFSPSADAIIEAQQLKLLPQFFKLIRFSAKVFYAALAVSLSYNILGLYFAISGQLSPFISGILMPISSITIIAMSTGLVTLKYSKLKREFL